MKRGDGAVSILKAVNTIVTVEPMFFFYYCSFGLGLVVWQQTLYVKLCIQKGFNISRCSNVSWEETHATLQQETSYWMIYSSLGSIPPAICCVTMLSGYSNHRSLRLPLVLPLIGGLLTAVLIILQIIFIDWDPSLLLIAPVAWGITGYFPTINMASMTYLIWDPNASNLGLRFAVLEGMNTLSNAVGTFLAGPIIDSSENGLVYAWILYGALQLVGLADILFRVKNIHSPQPAESESEYKRCSTIRHCFNYDSFKRYFQTVFRKRRNSKRLHLHIVVMSTMIAFLSLAGVTGIIFLYLTKQYGKSNTEYSIYQGANCLTALLGSTLFVHIFTTHYKLSDIGFTVLGTISGAISYLLLGYAEYAACYWLAVLFRLFVPYPWVGGRLYISHTLNEAEQASGMGYYATVQCVTTLLASLLFNSTYPLTLNLWPGLCFAIAAFLLLLTVPALTFVQWNDNRLGHFSIRN
ncbi:proton-coupled folate transporter-like [Watersipora subatra]|uniref:proton-coupled folate transporter-like n=1 Tax=Watersipora subatra TaxID=2589382 RepID=UPI00355C44F3